MSRAAWPGVALAAFLLLLLAPAAQAQEAPASCAPGLAARPEGGGSVLVTWRGVEGATGHRVLRAEDSGAYQTLALLPASATEWRDESTTPGTTYRYLVETDLSEAPAVVDGRVACQGAEASVIPYSRGILTAVGIAALSLVGYAAVRASA